MPSSMCCKVLEYGEGENLQSKLVQSSPTYAVTMIPDRYLSPQEDTVHSASIWERDPSIFPSLSVHFGGWSTFLPMNNWERKKQRNRCSNRRKGRQDKRAIHVLEEDLASTSRAEAGSEILTVVTRSENEAILRNHIGGVWEKEGPTQSSKRAASVLAKSLTM